MQERMKKYKLHYAAEAQRDMDDIWDYIMSELHNPSAAERVVNGIMDAADQLEDFSEMGAMLASVADVETDYRFLVCGNYLAFYRISDDNIYVDRVLYGRRDYLHVLFGDTVKEETTE